MWKKVELNSKKGLFLLRNGLYIKPGDITSELKDKVIGYVLDTSGKYSDRNIIISINSSEKCIEWGSTNGIMFKNIKGLINYVSSYGSSGPYNDTNGRYNTKCMNNHILLYGKKIIDESPALDYCINFSPGFRDGEWYLPSMGEMKLFYDNRRKFRFDCDISGIKTNMNLDNIGANFFWSSTLYSENYSWSLSFSHYHLSHSLSFSKNNYFYVVPFLAF
jgi:hypothetical protein